MSVSAQTEAWLEKALHDREAAVELARSRGVDLSDIVCYHCHQAAEKYLKAVLMHHGIVFPKTHDLVRLVKMASAAATDLFHLMDNASEFAPYDSEIRYADVMPDQSAMTWALDAMEVFRTVCLHALEIEE